MSVLGPAIFFNRGFTPAVRVDLDGIDITANLIPTPFSFVSAAVRALGGGVGLALGRLPIFGEDGGGPLLSITVTDNEGLKSDSVELEIDNREQFPAPRKGSKFQVWLGYVETGLVDMGTFQTDTWTKKGRPRTLTVSAKAVGLTTDIKAPKSRSYHETTIGEIVEKVAQKNSLSALVHPDLKSIKIGHIDQSSESDLHFMTRIGKRVGGNFKLANGNMILNKAGSGQLPSGASAPVFDFDEVGALDWSATGSERGSYGSAAASWQDTEKGERTEESEGGGKPKHRDRKLYKTQDEAKAAAKANLSSLNRGKVSYERSAPMQSEIFAGARANVFDHDPDVDGLFSIKTATHTVNGSGAKSSFSCESTNEEGGGDVPFTAGGDEGDSSE